MFNLIHQANENDDWLLTASSVILSKLYGFYISILTKVDPSLGSGDDIRPYLTAPLKRNHHALNALSSILVLVVDLSDVHTIDGSETDMIRCLKQFVNVSAYVLFDRKNKVMGLQANTNKKTNETTYAMDNLLRQTGFLISDVLCSYNRLVHAAEKLLTRRLGQIFSLIGSSMELSVQRSMIIVLKTLYDCKLAKHKRKRKSTQEHDDEQDNAPTLCEDIIQHMYKSPMWNERAINAFKLIESDAVTNNMPEELNRKVMMELFSVTDMLDNHCFNTAGCKVQIKYQTKINKKATRALFKDAYVDWNATSIVTHIEGGDTWYWPLFRLTHFEWRMRSNDVILKFGAWDKSDPVDISVRFHNGLDAHLKDTIHSHLDQVLKTSELSASTDCELRNKDWAQDAPSDQLKKIHNRIVTEKSSFSGSTTEKDTHSKDTLTYDNNSLVIDCMVESDDTPAGSLFENGNEDGQIELFQNQAAGVVDNGSNNGGKGVQIDPSSMSLEKVNEESGQDNENVDGYNGEISEILENIEVGQTNGSSAIDIDNNMGVESNQPDGVMNSQMSLGTNMDMDMSMDMNASMDLNMSMDVDENADANMNVGNEMSLEPDNDDDKDEDYCPGVKDTTQCSANETNHRTRSTEKNKQKGTEVAKDSVTVEKEIASDEHMNGQHLSVNDSEYESEIVCEVMDDLEFSNSLDVGSDQDGCHIGCKDSMDVQAGTTNPMALKDTGGIRDRYDHGRTEVADADEDEDENEDSDGDDDDSDDDNDGNAADGGEIHYEGDEEEEFESESNTDEEEEDEDEDEGEDDGSNPNGSETEYEHDVDYDDDDEDDTSAEDDEDDEDYKGEDSGDDENSDEEEVPHRMKLAVRSRSRAEQDPAKSVFKNGVGKKKTAKSKGRNTDDVDKTGAQTIEGDEAEEMNGQETGRFDWLAMNTANLLCQIDDVRYTTFHYCFLLDTAFFKT